MTDDRDLEPLAWDGVLIVGGGLAGLSAALAAAGAGRSVLVVASHDLGSGAASLWAQGGVAVALSPDDSPELHAADTVAAGAGLVDPAMARLLAREGPSVVLRLAALGAPFDRDAEGRFIQGLEAAHSRARVARVGGDGAGRAIMAAVIQSVRRDPLIQVMEGSHARGLLQDAEGAVVGVLVQSEAGLRPILARAVVLATGGLGGLYAVTTNPATARGSGLAMAAAAGALIADPEFVQFHPTAIDVGRDPAPLATEALRGEGATLVDAEGAPFMKRYDPRADLAPRDIVSRAIERQLRSGHGAFLDARAAVGAHFPSAFPAVFAACMAAGVDPRRQTVPVAPAAHYHMGGIKTDDFGRTTVKGLFSVGETASTGVHGANRLASNSLLEAAVFGARAGAAAATEAARPSLSPRALRAARPLPRLPGSVLQGLRDAMSLHAGVVRTEAGLDRLLGAVAEWRGAYGAAPELIAAELIAVAAKTRRESRGGHYREDYPGLLKPARTILSLSEALDVRIHPLEPVS